MPRKKNTRQKLSPREARDLDIEIGFLEGVARRDPGYTDALVLLGDDYTRRGRFAEGLQVDLQLCQHQPQNPLTYYNLACSYSLTQQPEAAIAALQRALDLGYRDFRWLRRDPDLNNVRQHPLYRGIRERIRAIEPQTR
jgi:tetratricopeptide (TPR) repeat protein